MICRDFTGSDCTGIKYRILLKLRSAIAGHRSRNGYKYFLDIELFRYVDEVYITILWETL